MKFSIVVLLYKRPYHSIQVFESLIRNRVNTCIAFMDFPEDSHCRSMQRIIKDYIKRQKKLKIDLICRKKRYGLAKSVVSAVTSVLEEYEGILLLEDDCVLRPGGIFYFEDSLHKLQHNTKIRSICGYLYPKCNFKWGLNTELLLLRRFCPWGWATWRDRWKDYNPNLSEVVKKVESNGIHISSFSNDIGILCKDKSYLNGLYDIWSLNWIMEHYASSTFSVFPRETVIENIGFDGSGQNCVNTQVFNQTVHFSKIAMRDFHKLEYYLENEIILKHFMDQFGLMTYPTH